MSVADALNSGEEYELLVAGSDLDVAQFEKELGVPLTAVATARALASGEQAGVEGASSRGARVAREGGHDHFSS